MDPFVGEIRIFTGNYAPLNWALCNGAIMQTRQYPALYSVLGNRFGGTAPSTFALPNLQANVPMGMGTGPGLTPRSLGNVGGATSVQLTSDQMAQHGHGFNCFAASGTTAAPNSNYPAGSGHNRQTGKYTDTPYSTTTTGAQMSRLMVAPTGGSVPHNNVQPYLAINFIIALVGILPTAA